MIPLYFYVITLVIISKIYYFMKVYSFFSGFLKEIATLKISLILRRKCLIGFLRASTSLIPSDDPYKFICFFQV